MDRANEAVAAGLSDPSGPTATSLIVPDVAVVRSPVPVSGTWITLAVLMVALPTGPAWSRKLPLPGPTRRSGSEARTTPSRSSESSLAEGLL
ncbi:hypothetical protein [Nonomuraea sp. NPDC049400]|uniref:hypothetical protein n=1 Tax=Nonomuraea sp. NPDC049400 TaxID=3364352 RepID=UPI0037986709